ADHLRRSGPPKLCARTPESLEQLGFGTSAMTWIVVRTLLADRMQPGCDQGSETSGGVTVQKLVVSSIALLLIALGWGHGSFGEQAPAPQGELRIVDKSPFNWVWITRNVFEHLMELDKDGTLVPRLATSWQWLNDRTLEVKLREGVRFHNGEVFD